MLRLLRLEKLESTGTGALLLRLQMDFDLISAHFWRWKNMTHLRRRATYLWGKGRPQFANVSRRNRHNSDRSWRRLVIWYDLIWIKNWYLVISFWRIPSPTRLIDSSSSVLFRVQHSCWTLVHFIDAKRLKVSDTCPEQALDDAGAQDLWPPKVFVCKNNSSPSWHLGSHPDDPTLIYHPLHPTLIYMYSLQICTT